MCKYCNVVDDEDHFVLKCTKNETIRKALFDDIKLDFDQFSELSDDLKLYFMLTPKTMRHVRIIGFFFKRSFELRTEDL